MLAHPIDPSALECCSPVVDDRKIEKFLDDLDFNEFYKNDFFDNKFSKQKVSKVKGNLLKCIKIQHKFLKFSLMKNPNKS